MNIVSEDSITGRLIVVEGLDGSGKSTQIELLRKWLLFYNIKVASTEWNSSELVRSAMKRGKKKKLFTPSTFSLLHATDFADRYERQILPHLKAGYIVLADRYVYTAFARDCARGCSAEWVEGLYDFAIKPHISLFFRVPLETAIARVLDGRQGVKFYEAGMDLGFADSPVESFKLFQGRVAEEYEKVVEKHSLKVIDGTMPIKKQQDEVRKIVGDSIELKNYKYRGTEKRGAGYAGRTR